MATKDIIYKAKNILQIELDALESALIVFEDAKLDLPQYKYKEMPEERTRTYRGDPGHERLLQIAAGLGTKNDPNPA